MSLPTPPITPRLSSGSEGIEQSTVVPPQLRRGVPMLKISSKKIKQVIIRIQDNAIDWSNSKGTKVPISAVRELRLNQPPADTYPSQRWITVVYTLNSQYKVLHMTALTDDVYELWTKTLTSLVSETSDRLVAQVTPADPDLMWIRQLWPAGAKLIDFGTASGLCGGLGMIIPSDVAERYSKAPLDLAAFRQLIKEAQTRPELRVIYDELASSGTLGRTKVERFLQNVQRLDPRDIFDKYQENDLWTLDGLTEFLLSADNSQAVEQDMTRPLPEYFISSSHNTYLVGEQWRGESTVEGYIRVLLAKCRCVEMDCHDGDVEPEVFHMKTLTSKVPVRDICQAIKKYAFITSPYPVIISTEVHCSLEQQEKLGAILREVFADQLVVAPLEGISGMVSPDQLRGKILFKAKPPTPKKQPTYEPLPSDTTSSTDTDSGFARLARRLSIGSSKEKPSFAPTLSDLLVYTAGVKYQGFSKLVQYELHEQFSVSEKTGTKIIRENKGDWVKHNFNHLSRVYPKGFRLASSNYDPTPFWQAGNQLVALNWQTVDHGAILNHAMFDDTPGYILKPPALRSKTAEASQRYTIRLHVISAQRLPLSSDLYVEAKITHGSPDTPTHSRTGTIKGKALNPVWNETMVFGHTTTPSMLDLTFLHVEIKGKGQLAQWVRPVGSAPRGYHHLPLYDSLFSRYVFATLFVRIDVEVAA